MADPIYSALHYPRRPIVCVSPQVTVAQCVDMMTKEDIGALVVHDGEKLIGIVTERDVLRHCLHHGLDPYETSASEIAYADVSILNLFDPVEKAMEIITQTKRRHVLVAEGDKLVGLLSIGDILFHLLDDRARVIEQLQNYIYA